MVDDIFIAERHPANPLSQQGGKIMGYNRRFLELCSHHLVEPVACTPGAGWEKGQVERQVGDVRGRLFVPSPRGRSYAEINAWLMDRCIEDAKKRPHPTIEGKTVWQVFEEERPFLMAYRGPFDGFHATEVSVSKTCLVRFDNNHYSVAARAVGRTVDVRAYADRIVIRQDGETVAEHPRSFGRGEIAYDPWHYVPILTRKPGALRNGAPFKGWQLPGALGRMRARLAGEGRDGEGLGGTLRCGGEHGVPLASPVSGGGAERFGGTQGDRESGRDLRPGEPEGCARAGAQGAAARRQGEEARPLARAGAGSHGADRCGMTVSAVLPRVDAAALTAALDPVVAKDALLVSDGGASYPPCAAALGVSHETLNRSMGERVRGDLHVQDGEQPPQPGEGLPASPPRHRHPLSRQLPELVPPRRPRPRRQ